MSSLFAGGRGVRTRIDLTVTWSFGALTFAVMLTRCPAWPLRTLGFATVQIFWSFSAIKLFSSRLTLPVMVAGLEAEAVGGFVCGFALRVFRQAIAKRPSTMMNKFFIEVLCTGRRFPLMYA